MMETKAELLRMVDEYRQHFDKENKHTQALLEFVVFFDKEALFSRKNFVGHLTASAYILNSSRDALLLLKHKSLNRWLQPGGHIEYNDASVMGAALREVEEETGIAPGNLTLATNSIFDIDSHSIPANNSKMEPAHYHHDISFLFICTDPQQIKFDNSESTAGRWMTFPELSSHDGYDKIMGKISKLLRERQ